MFGEQGGGPSSLWRNRVTRARMLGQPPIQRLQSRIGGTGQLGSIHSQTTRVANPNACRVRQASRGGSAPPKL